MQSLCGRTAAELSMLLGQNEVSSREVVQAHLDRISQRDGALKAFTQVFAERALREAAERDAKKGPRGPLHGLPVTIKENIEIAGEAATFGVPSRASHKAALDAPIVTLLREAGAVILGRTNVAQLGLFAESRNPLFGQTANPWSAKHGPGGSSGGEGAAIAAGMSPLGIGTDIGGSIRVPAHFCGIAGFKPTLDRLPMRGVTSGIAGQEAVRAMCGPMARTARDCALLLEGIDLVRGAQLDGRTTPLAFRAAELGRPRVGLCLDEGVIAPSLALQRGARLAAEALRSRGCEIVEWRPPRAREALFLQIAAMSADGGAGIRRELRGQPIDPALRSLMRIAQMPALLRRGLSSTSSDALVAGTLRSLGRKPVEELWRLTAAIRAWRFEVLQSMDAAGIDLFVSAPYATPALPHFGSSQFTLAGAASMLWNVAQLPAGVVPVTRVLPEEARREAPSGRLEKLAALVDAQSAGLPVGAQIVGRPWADDQVLAAMRAVEDEVRHAADFPRTPVD